MDRRAFALNYVAILVGTIGLGLAVFAVGAGLMVTTIAVMHLGVQGKQLAQGVTVLAIAALVAVPVLWASLAACVKRARDIGLNPFLLVGLMVAMSFLDKLFLRSRWESGFVWPFEHMTAPGGAGQLTLLLVLLLWPSRPGTQARDAAEVFA
jgi:uncharacterized membrane protein YhaH (DUF805 family)